MPAHPTPCSRASALIAFKDFGGELSYTTLTSDPGPETTVPVLEEILMVTCAGRLIRTRRVLLQRRWSELDTDTVGAYQTSLTPRTALAVAGVGHGEPAHDKDLRPRRMRLTDPPGTASHLYILCPARRLELYTADHDTWKPVGYHVLSAPTAG